MAAQGNHQVSVWLCTCMSPNYHDDCLLHEQCKYLVRFIWLPFVDVCGSPQ
jgi:hypothetical protein